MLVIRMQRTGRKGHAQFRVVVQDSRRTPTSGKIVAALGFYNPHTKETNIDKERAEHFLKHGAQPSERVVRLLQAEKVKLPKWVNVPSKKTKSVKNAEKRRSTRPDEPAETTEAPAESEQSEVPEATESSEPSSDEAKEEVPAVSDDQDKE